MYARLGPKVCRISAKAFVALNGKPNNVVRENEIKTSRKSDPSDFTNEANRLFKKVMYDTER